MNVLYEKVIVTGTTGGAGASTANNTSVNIVNGHIVAIHLAYAGTPPNTTDVTIATATAPTLPILTVSNGATDGWRYPQAATVDTSGTAITGVYADIFVNDKIVVTIAQANDDDGVTATIIYERY
jgi:hypothetical protein